MAELVAAAIDGGRHLVVQAGTGTGKTLAYLVPADRRRARASSWPRRPRRCRTSSPARTCRSCSGAARATFDWAVLKGRSNYVCLQRLREVHGAAPEAQLELEGMTAATLGRDPPHRRVGRHHRHRRRRRARLGADRTRRGGRSASAATSARAPTAARSASRASPSRPAGGPRPPTSSSSTPTSTGSHVGSGGVILPEHDVVVFDEAHVLEDVMSDTVGVQLAPGRFVTLAGTCGGSSTTRS